MIFIGAPTKRAMFKRGSYVGDGTDARAINIGINLFAKYPAWVRIKGMTAVKACHTIFEAADSTQNYDAVANFAGGIEQLTTTGFQVGTSNQVNQTGVTYYYTAFWIEG